MMVILLSPTPARMIVTVTIHVNIDCDDGDAAVTNTNENDADCDGVLDDTDLDANGDGYCDSAPTILLSEDTDCDSVIASIDCDDGDALVTNTNENDADCDGIDTSLDCDDGDPSITNTNENDADCDLAATSDDCDDSNPLLGTIVDDSDCDGIINAEDICLDGDDLIDLDENGTPDACDVVCTFGDCDLSVDMGNNVHADFVLIDQLEDPLGRYTLSNSFYMMTTEVTQDMFQEVMGYDCREGEDTNYGNGADFPAYYVSWHMAAHFTNVLSESQGIPEEEWCYSCTGSGTSVTCSETMDPYLCTSYSLPTEHE